MRATVASPDYCQHCHEETQMKKDPLDISHETLVSTERWDTCLGCHDFHGNHVMEVPLRVHDATSPDLIQAYLRGGDSPYPAEKRYEARKEPQQ